MVPKSNVACVFVLFFVFTTTRSMSWIVADLLSPGVGGLPYNTVVLVGNFEKKKTLRGIKILFSGCGLECFSPLRDNSSRKTHWLLTIHSEKRVGRQL